jgi:saccharopine dehydrogenase (NAD+, L-lysine-forming)
MSGMPPLWLRREVAPIEQRTPIVPADAARLIEAGASITVEESARRAFPITQYAAAGCRIVPADTWPDAPPDHVVIGLKAPAPEPFALSHQHIFFGHAYKGQVGAERLLERFAAGGGTLLDLESLTDDEGRRVVAFGFWAGYAGAALAVLLHRGELTAPLRSTTRADVAARLAAGFRPARVLVIGALGRSGRGACEALAAAGVAITRWDVDETRDLDRAAVLDHDILVNTVMTTEPGTPFVTADDLDRRDRRLAVVSDVTCDVTSDCNRLPVNDTVTDWDRPVRRLRHEAPAFDVLAIDNLPSLVPGESSTSFSADLLPHLGVLADGEPIWDRCLAQFRTAERLLTREGVHA